MTLRPPRTRVGKDDGRTCRELIAFLREYLDGELPPERRAVFDLHLARCVNCANYLQNYTDLVKLGKAALEPSDAPIPASVPEELVQAILAARPRNS